MIKKNWMGMMVGFLSLLGSVSWASGPGTTAANVLGIGVGARAIGMGEAYTAMADDVSSLYWNPAGLALLNQSQASFMYNQAYRDMSFNNANLGLSLENGGVGASLSYLSFGKIEGFNDVGDPTGNVNAYSGVATFGGGWLLGPAAVGANVKLVQGALADEKATGAAFDLGANYVHPQQVFGEGTLRFGAVLRNMGTGMKYLQQRDPFPTEYRVGGSLLQLLHEQLNLSVDYGKTKDTKGSVYGGAEYWFRQMLALRAGYAGNHTEGNGIRAGIGFRFKDVSFDYAYSNFGELGMSHRYELIYRFGEIRPRLTPEERKMYRQAKAAIRDGRYGQAVLLMDGLIRAEPNYKPFRRTYKVAARGDESQERFAKSQNAFSKNLPHNTKVGESMPELDDLENLLAVSEQADQSVMAPPSMGAKQ